MKKLSFILLAALAMFSPAIYAQEAAPAAEEKVPAYSPSYPADTLAVVRLKSFETLGNAFDELKKWVGEHPSVESLFDDEWQGVKKFDLRSAAAQYLDLTQDEFDSYFEGAITLIVGNNYQWAQETKMLPVAMELTASSSDRAKEFIDMLKEEDGVLETSMEPEGVERIKIDITPVDEEGVSDAVEAPAAQKNEMDIFVAQEGSQIVLGNSLEYTIAAVKSLRTPMPSDNAFWTRVEGSDAAMWVDAQAVVAMVKAQMEAKKAAGGRGMDAKIIDELGLGELEGLGVWATFVPLKLQLELSYSPSATGIARIFNCTPTGLEPTPLIPADVDEFSIGRADIACLWTELRRMAKIVVPATDVIYQGWSQQLEASQGVNIDKQLFGALGNKYVFFTRGTKDRPEGSALYLAVNDAVALQGGLDAFFGFFAQGKEFFDREKIAGIPVWRLKSEFQSANAPPIAYAITPQWVIVSVGDPTQMQELIENAAKTQVESPIFARDAVKEVLANPSVTTFSHRPLKIALANVAAAVMQINERQEQEKGAPAKPSAQKDFPSFHDVTESVIMWNENRPGSVMATIKIISNNE